MTDAASEASGSSQRGGGGQHDRGRQLLRRELPAVLHVDGGRGRRCGTAGARHPCAARRAARPLSPHSVLPQALPLLLLPGLHGQERRRGAVVPRRAGSRVGAVRRAAGHRGPPARLRLLRRRDPVVPLGPATARSGRSAVGRQPVVGGERDHLRVRAGDPDGVEAGRDPRAGRDAAQPRRRALRRPGAGDQRPGAQVGGDLPRLRVRPLGRVPADQHRSHRRHARRERRQVAGGGREGHRARSGQRHHLPDGAALQHDHQQRPAARERAVRAGGRPLVDEAALGGRGVHERWNGPATRSAAPTPRSRIRRARVSSTGTGSGRARTWPGSAWRPSGTSTASTCRTSTRGAPTRRRSRPAVSHSIGPTGRRTRNASSASSCCSSSWAPSARPTSARSTASSVRDRFTGPLASLARDGYLDESSPETVRLSRGGLLRVDSLLPRFFLPAHTDIRYT